MKKISILALHLAFGGIEKAICSMANIFAERYEVEILSVYNMPNSPAFPLDERVKLTYLTDVIPNRQEWKDAVKHFDLPGIIRESVKSARVLTQKKKAVISAISSVKDGVLITTRHEDNVLLSRYGSPEVLKIAQLHHDHAFKELYVKGFKNDYGNIDILAMLTPGLRDEARDMLREKNKHTEVVYIPNFLEHFPDKVSVSGRRKCIVSVGRLNPVKRFDLLIRQFCAVRADFPDWTLRIIGDGEEMPKLKALITELHAEDCVILTGRKDSRGVEEEMLSAAFYAMSSETEGFPFVLIEAQSCALPIAAYDVRVGPGFIIHNGEDGFLADKDSDEEYRAVLRRLMSSEELRERLGAEALKNSKLYSKENVSKIWYDILG